MNFKHKDEAELRTNCDITRSVKINKDCSEKKTFRDNGMKHQLRNKTNQAVIKSKTPEQILMPNFFEVPTVTTLITVSW